MACRVAITISAMGNSFLFFLEFLSLAVGGGFFNFSGTRSTHSACAGAYIDPPPGIPCRTLPGKPAAPWVPASLV
nr:MAG TPA: hypothetical protein [Caudoviricetes sp.]